MKRRVLLLVGVIGLAGCVDGVAIPRPPAPTEAGTVVVAFESLDALWVIDPHAAEELTPIAVPPDLEANAYAFALPPSALQVVPGLVQRPAAPLRLLPATMWSASAGVVDRVLTWSADPVPRPAPRLPLPAFDWSRCLEGGGCAPPRPWDYPYCNSPCPEPPAPSPPAAPTEPEGGAWDMRDGEPIVTAKPDVPCEPHAMQSFGEGACAPVSDCAEDWPAAPPGVLPVVHVDAGAAPGGDGSAERPYRDPADALAMARPAGAVLLRAGTYTLPAHLTLEAQTVVGACSERSILQTSGDALSIDASQASLRDLTLPPTHLQSGALALARIEGTALDRALEVDAGARLTAERLLIRGGAEGIVVQAGAEVTLEDVALEDLTGDGLRLLGGATAGARIVIRRLPASAALRVSGAQATLQSLDVADTAAPVVLSDGAEARLDGVVLTRTTRDTGVGFLATDSELTLSRALVYNLRGQSFDLREGTRASIQDLVVLDNVPVHHRETIELGRACQLDLTRAFIREDHEGVVRTSDEDTRAVALTDVRIQARHVAPEVSTVVLIESGSLLMRRVRLEGGASDSVDVRMTPQPVVLEDLDLEGGKIGVTVDPGVDVTGSRVRARGQLQDGLLFTGFGEVADTLQLLDAEVSGSQGNGININRPAAMTLERFRVSGCASTGILVGPRSSIALRRGEIGGNKVGVALDPAGYTTDEDLVEEVRFVDNETNLTR